MMYKSALLENPASFSRDAIAQTARSTDAIAIRCDSLCLDVGAELCKAVPALDELTRHLTSLGDALGGDGVVDACATLRSLAAQIMKVMEELGKEGSGLKALATDSKTLSKLIDMIAEDIRFLSAMITNVKIEAYSLDQTGEGLQAFAEDLAQLAAKANGTISTCQSTHSSLLDRISRAAKLQADFETTRLVDLEDIARELGDSIAALDQRRSSVSSAAADTARMTQSIGERVGHCVIALQIGDNIRQRVEHAGSALRIAIDELEIEGSDLACADVPGYTASVIGRLQALQLTSAAADFDAEIRSVESNLGEIHLAAADLRQQSLRLTASDKSESNSFLGDLEVRLQRAYVLIGDYRMSRTKIDEVITAVATTFVELEALGKQVSAMVVDMTIIGMNAIVRSYGLGSRGAGLSVIAQHLRAQAMKVSDGIKSLGPALGQSREASAIFAEVSSGLADEQITKLKSGLEFVIATFNNIGGGINDIASRLDSNVDELDRILPQALRDLAAARDVDRQLAVEIEELDRLVYGGPVEGQAVSAVLDVIDRRLAPLYTMAPERQVHSAFFGHRSAALAPADDGIDDLMF